MKNTKKIFALLILSIIIQTKNIKSFSKKTVEQVHFVTSIMTIIPSIMPEINGGKKWHNFFNKHKKWENLSIKINKPNSWDIIENNILIELYAPTLFNQILAASLDKDLDIITEIIENTKRTKHFLKKIENFQSKDYKILLGLDLGITTSEILTKAVARVIITKLLKNHRISKRISKIIILSALDLVGNLLRVKISEEIKKADSSYNVDKIFSTAFISSIAKNIVVETLGENIQRLFIDDEKTKKQKYLHQQIKELMSNNESVLRLKNSSLETKPIKIK